MSFEDILYEEKNHVAYITINRPRVYNAFRPKTCEELIEAFNQAGWNKDIAVIVFAGAGEKAFCTGGDQSEHEGQYKGIKGRTGMPVDQLHSIIRSVPKPVIAKVQGYAIGGGNVLTVLCDMTICSENAKFGQVGPKMGSVDPGYGTAYLARVVGEKKAREIWYMCRQYSGKEAVEMGLANVCVPNNKLDEEVEKWCAELIKRSPTAMAIAKRSFNVDTEHIGGIGQLGFECLRLYYDTDESREGVTALSEKREPNFAKYVK
ncbi:MAG: enoyl-CoA hydratase/isomerase family protein [Candidatus Lambdaproteobacteria bacterium]|nr:enoyl-CoA hydratase/isomerase family protein [Candidatus Lambdaproteobacteria bacterium]